PMKRDNVAESVAGESVAASEITDITTTTNGVPGKNGAGVGQGGVSLAGLSINDIGKQASLSQSDRLKRYVEGGTLQPSAGLRGTSRLDDDDVRSVSTAFASQVGLGGYD
ncbi:hypothetical protein KCU94_g17780, partial [Aureobasidium melanogenum]